MPYAVPVIVNTTDPEAGMFKTDVDETVGAAYERAFDKEAIACNTEMTTAGDLETDPHVLILKRESVIQKVASTGVPDMQTLRMDEKALVPKPAPETEMDNDPLPGTKPGIMTLIAGVATKKSETNRFDALEVKDATMPILF
jgi:hypothetical protein